jgi:hypothetical protein
MFCHDAILFMSSTMTTTTRERMTMFEYAEGAEEWIASLAPVEQARIERAGNTPLSDPRWVLAGSFTIGEDAAGNPTMEWVEA